MSEAPKKSEQDPPLINGDHSETIDNGPTCRKPNGIESRYRSLSESRDRKKSVEHRRFIPYQSDVYLESRQRSVLTISPLDLSLPMHA